MFSIKNLIKSNYLVLPCSAYYKTCPIFSVNQFGGYMTYMYFRLTLTKISDDNVYAMTSFVSFVLLSVAIEK